LDPNPKQNALTNFWEVAVEAHRFRRDFLFPSRAGSDLADPAGTTPPSDVVPGIFNQSRGQICAARALQKV
jgi:hypothetical protein